MLVHGHYVPRAPDGVGCFALRFVTLTRVNHLLCGENLQWLRLAD
ncbi:MAG TPA: hypothetical protein VGF13_14105 [Verrucomicrobiae bacterium]|jgi:hypothetical protein